MHIASHLQKIANLEAARARFDPLADFELWFWASMSAGTHALNAALHHAGLTVEEDAYAMQPGVYLVPQPGGALVAQLREPGDVLHLGRPPIKGQLPGDIQEMAHAMETIEAFRDPCVREGRPVTPDIVASCRQAYDAMVGLLNSRLLRQPA